MIITFTIHHGEDNQKQTTGTVFCDGTIHYDKSLGDEEGAFNELIDKSFGYITEKKKYEIAREKFKEYLVSGEANTFLYTEWLDNKLNNK